MEATNEKTGAKKVRTKKEAESKIEAQRKHRATTAIVRGQDGLLKQVERIE